MRTLILIILVFLPVGSASAQHAELITAANVARLASVSHIDFESFVEQDVVIKNGWFTLTESGEYLAVQTDACCGSEILVLQDAGDIVATMQPPQLADEIPAAFFNAVFDSDSEQLAAVHTGEPDHFLTTLDVTSGVQEQTPLEFFPSDVWYEDQQLWVHNASPFDRERQTDNIQVTEFAWPAEDRIRIGRIQPPLAVTITEDGRVKRWNMETGEVTAEIQLDPEAGLPIYGAVNAGGDSHLVWRDPASTALSVLNFETGENRKIVQLDGTYIPFTFLSSHADVIIGVNVNDAPVVVAWDVETGLRYDLGEYRSCSRPPDMARLSHDGTTLVIGCDTGIDIWRIQ